MPQQRPTRRSVLAGTGALCLSATACGGGGFTETDSSSGSDGSDATVLRMLVNITPNLTKSYWRELVAPYEEEAGVEVRIEAPTGSGVKDSLPQLLAAGDAPDIVETLMVDETLAPQMAELTDASWVQDTPLVEEAMLGDAIYTVGVGVQAQSLVYYNQQAFEDANIASTPTNLDELTETMAALKAADYLPFRTAGDYVTGLQLLQLCWPSVIAGDEDWYANVRSGAVGVGETFLPYFELYSEWLSAGYIDEQALGLKDVDAQTDFFAGKSGMYVMGSWLVSSATDADTAIDIGVFTAPTLPGQPYPGPLGATMALPYMVLKSSPNVEAAQDLIRWLVTDEQAVTTQLQQDGNFRAGTDWCETDVCSAVQQVLDDAPSTTPQGEGYGDQTLPPGFNTEFNKQVQALYVGTEPAEAADALDAWMEQNS